jgi:hypothetical protein
MWFQNNLPLFFTLFFGFIVCICNTGWYCIGETASLDATLKSCHKYFALNKETAHDSTINPGIKMEIDGTGKKVVSFYNKEGKKINSFPRNQLPDQSPYSKLKFPYFADVNDDQIFEKHELKDASPFYGYFDLSGHSFSSIKQNFNEAKINVSDSILKKTFRIYHSPVRIESYNKGYLATKSLYYITDEAKKTIWRSEYVSVYNIESKLVREFEINQNLGWKGCISGDGLYLLMSQSLDHDVTGQSDDPLAENWTENNYPLKLLNLESGDFTLLTFEFQEFSILEMEYFYDMFQIVYDTNIHVMLDFNNRKTYYKHYGDRKRDTEPLITVLKRKRPDISQYNMSDY